MSIAGDSLFDVKDCAMMLEITQQGIRKAIKEKRLKGRRFGNSWVITADDLKQFCLNKHEREIIKNLSKY